MVLPDLWPTLWAGSEVRLPPGGPLGSTQVPKSWSPPCWADPRTDPGCLNQHLDFLPRRRRGPQTEPYAPPLPPRPHPTPPDPSWPVLFWSSLIWKTGSGSLQLFESRCFRKRGQLGGPIRTGGLMVPPSVALLCLKSRTQKVHKPNPGAPQDSGSRPVQSAVGRGACLQLCLLATVKHLSILGNPDPFALSDESWWKSFFVSDCKKEVYFLEAFILVKQQKYI